MLNLLIFLLMPDGVIVMAIDDRVKNASFWLGIGEFLVRCILWCILYFMVVVSFGGIRCRATVSWRHEMPRYIFLYGFGGFVDAGGG